MTLNLGSHHLRAPGRVLPAPPHPVPGNHRPCRRHTDTAPQPQDCLGGSGSGAQVLSSRPSRLGSAHPPVSAPESTQSSSSPPAFGFMARVPSTLPQPRDPPRASDPASATTRPRAPAARRALSRPRPPLPLLCAARARRVTLGEDRSVCTGCAHVHERERECRKRGAGDGLTPRMWSAVGVQCLPYIPPGKCQRCAFYSDWCRPAVNIVAKLPSPGPTVKSLESPGLPRDFPAPVCEQETPTSATRAGRDISI